MTKASTVPASSSRGKARAAALLTATGLVVSLAALGSGAQAASAPDDLTIDFSEGYALGNPVGQNGWTGANGFDYGIVDNADFPSAASGPGSSLRFSNATADSSITQLLSPVVTDAGESTEASKSMFEATLTVASTTGGLQPGLNVEVAVDDNVGSRTGGVVSLRHSDTGLEIGTYWVPTDATGLDYPDWRSAVVAVVPADVAHTIKLVVTFKDGAAADTLAIYVDGVLTFTAGTYEYFHLLLDDSKHVANSLLFRAGNRVPAGDGIGWSPTGVTSLPAVDGEGFLFSGIAYRSVAGPLPEAPPPAESSLPPASGGFTPAGGAATSGLGSIDPRESFGGEQDWSDPSDSWVDVYAYSSPIFLGTFPVVGGKVVLTGIDLSALAAGGHKLVFIGQTSTSVQVVAISIKALAVSGAEGVVPLAGGALGVLLIGASLMLRARRARSGASAG